ncbi:MAG: tetratricopeptide repeat protein [Candidatus Omnitrophica bacterium]|nr:tetratricopeptide repeat protein [Candidatus Omnitrophota bacterium]
MLIYIGSHSFCLAKAYNEYSNKHIVNLGQIDSVMEESQGMIKEGKADAKIYLKLGTIYARRMDWQNARSYLEKAIEMDRNTNFAYNNLGNVYFYLENIDKAIDCYRKAIAINPDYLIARYNLGFAYFKKIQIKDAMKELDFILAKEKNDFQAWQMRQLIFE